MIKEKYNKLFNLFHKFINIKNNKLKYGKFKK